MQNKLNGVAILIFLSDFCIGDEFIASCTPGSVVVMTHATFGIMSSGRCAKASNHCEEVY